MKGTIYFGSGDKNIYALNPDGTILWSYSTGGAVNSSPAIGPDGSIFIGSNDHKLYAIGPGDEVAINQPTNVQASDGKYSFKIQIIWEKPIKGTNPTGYKIFRSTSLNGHYTVIGQTGPETYYSDSKISDTNFYFYKVSSIKGSIESSLSTEDSGYKTEEKIPDEIKGWPIFMRDPARNARSPFIGPAHPYINWIYQTKGSIELSPVIGIDNTIYVSCEDKSLYAVSSKGALKWNVPIGSVINTPPAISNDGTIFIGCEDSKLYAINQDGSSKWSFKTGDSIESSPAFGEDGTIYFGSNDHYLYALKPNGSLKWKFITSNRICSSPAIDANTNIYFGCKNGSLYSINQNGSLIWECKTANTPYSSPTINIDGSILIGDFDGYLYQSNNDGTERNRFEVTFYGIDNSSAINADGSIYICGFSPSLCAFNPNGSLKWRFETQAYLTTSPAISAEGTIYIGEGERIVYAINPDGTQKWALATDYPFRTPCVIGNDGSVIVGSYKCKLLSIGPGDGQSGLFPPVNISATNNTYHDKIQISWNEPSSGPVPDGYYVYRAISNSPNAINHYTGKTTSNSFDDSSVESGKTYYYKVQSYKFASGYNDSGYSIIDSGTRK